MQITIDFNDGAYLQLDKDGKICVYEDNEIDFEGNISDTLKMLPRAKKVELVKGFTEMFRKSIGVKNDFNRTGFKAVEWSR